MEPTEGRRDSSFCIPAFMAAAAASECGGVCEAGGDAEIGMVAGAEGGLEGSEFRSGGMVSAVVSSGGYLFPIQASRCLP